MQFSIITVTFNSEKTIERTLKSVLGQTFTDFEYIIIDGKSSDSTLKIIDDYKDEFKKKNITLTIISEKDNGIYDAMNKGIRISKGKIIGMINSDDWYEDDALETVNNYYIGQHFDMFYSSIRIHRENGKSFVKKSKPMKHYIVSKYWNHPTTFITKNSYLKYGLYKNDTIYDDWDLVLRFFKSGAKIIVGNAVLANFTMNGVSHSKGLKPALKRASIKYSIYRVNGYSWVYVFNCYLNEILKAIIH